jgi:hypothetical protein
MPDPIPIDAAQAPAPPALVMPTVSAGPAATAEQAAALGVPTPPPGLMEQARMADAQAGPLTATGLQDEPAPVATPLLGQEAKASEQGPHAGQPIPIPAAQPKLVTTDATLPKIATTRETQTSYTPGIEVPREIKDSKELTFENEQEALMTQRKVAEQKAVYDDAYQQERARRAAAEESRAALEKQEIQQRTDQQVAKVASLIQDFKQNSHVDQAKYFKDIGPLGSIITALGAAVGTIGAGIARIDNTAVRFIENQINRSIAAQEKEIEAKKDHIGMANNLLALYRQQGLDADQAHAAAKLTIREHYQTQMDSLAARFADTDIGAKYQMAAAGLQKIHDDEKMKLLEMEHAKQTFASMTKTAPVAYDREAQKDALARSVTLPNGMKAPDGGAEIPAKTPKLKEEMDQVLDSRYQILGDFETIKKHHTFGSSIAGKNKAIQEKAFSRITEQFHNLEGKGIRFTDSDRKMFEQIADPTSVWTTDSKLNATIEEATKALNRAVVSKGRQAFGEANPFQ